MSFLPPSRPDAPLSLRAEFGPEEGDGAILPPQERPVKRGSALSASGDDPFPASSSQPTRDELPPWMQRVSIVIFVVFCMELGVVLAFLPWTRFWTENQLLSGYPLLRAFLQENFVRGAVTGLGLVNVWIGLWEAVRYRERRRR